MAMANSGGKIFIILISVKSIFSLTELMVLHDLLRSMVTNQIAFLTNQIAFDKRDSKSISNVRWTVVARHWSLVVFFGFPNWKPWIPSVLVNCFGINLCLALFQDITPEVLFLVQPKCFETTHGQD